jgi:8-oxo-dGTP pyrophosphatase MutT (NUDIX family)
MQVVYAREPFPGQVTKSIFLAGPTPRAVGVQSWRPEALATLKALGYDGHVFVPEDRGGRVKFDYDDQVDWEEDGLQRADCIVFWVPREMQTMPALTTNDEWGAWKASGKVVFGAPPEAYKVKYQRHYASKLGVPQSETLEGTLKAAIEKVGNGAAREGGACQVPLHVWARPDFQNWLQTQQSAGNRLDGARVEWSFFVGPRRQKCFFLALHVNVHVTSEQRNKTNEIVLFRPHVSSVLLYHRRGPKLEDTEIVFVREFRSPANTWSGMVHELPGGSSPDSTKDARATAAEELEEETGFHLDPARLVQHHTRQVAATLSSYKSTLFVAELSTDEMLQMKARSGQAFGLQSDSERTYVEVSTLGSVLTANLVDWATLGLIFQALGPTG